MSPCVVLRFFSNNVIFFKYELRLRRYNFLLDCRHSVKSVREMGVRFAVHNCKLKKGTGIFATAKNLRFCRAVRDY